MQHGASQDHGDAKPRLQGFNNLTKTLSFNIYDVCYVSSELNLHAYLQYVDQTYNARRLTRLLREVADVVGANVLNVASTNYEPHGASATLLLAEGGPVASSAAVAAVAHLDKSHLTAHTYPESNPAAGFNTFRADVDVSTCGCISPLKALDHLLGSFESDVVYIDYRVRGFTRNADGSKCFIDHKIDSIQQYLNRQIRDCYRMTDLNLPADNIFHTRMILRELCLDDYLFNLAASTLSAAERLRLEQGLSQEITEIFNNGS